MGKRMNQIWGRKKENMGNAAVKANDTFSQNFQGTNVEQK